ncbi:MAG: DUF1592 domain-containing protein [Planctomycetaceae bacterium]|nr:DUF1592 domain-containing protein [Planctomycetaceae bacterium]
MYRFLRTRAPLLWLTVLMTQQVRAADDSPNFFETFDQHVKPFLAEHCRRCHNVDEMTSGIRVDHLTSEMELSQLRLWEVIRDQSVRRAMPPTDEPQPTEAERRQFENWIAQGLDNVRQRPLPKNGSIRRLTVAQYRNTIRELLLLEDDVADLLPPDAVSRDGFVNNQETLTLSPLLLETYLDIAEQALDRCIVDPDSKPVIQNFRMDLGAGINPDPCPDNLILGADSLLLNNADFMVTQLTAQKPFAFTPFRMQTKFRFIEGYAGNDTVRGWRDFDSIYHAVYACLRGSHGYPRGHAYSTVGDGLLLRPAIPGTEEFGVDSTYGPKANFKVSLRELPDTGRFRVTVMAAKYNDGLLLDRGAVTAATNTPGTVTWTDTATLQTILIPQSGIYQVDVYKTPGDDTDNQGGTPKTAELKLVLGDREFASGLEQPAFLIVRLPAGDLQVNASSPENISLDRIVLTPVDGQQDVARQFIQFENRSPRIGVHLGLRRDCGSTLSQVGEPQTVTGAEVKAYRFEGAIRNFPSPDVEKENENYLAGVREIGVRSEYTDGRDMPRLLIRSVEFEGPLYDAWPPESHRRIFIESKHQPEPFTWARDIIRDFAGRAFRRPITASEEDALLKVFAASYEEQGLFRDSVKVALQVVLTSPQFLFLIENSPSPAAEPLAPFELASKLSYFLWNGPPDPELLNAAASGTLSEHMDVQVDRLTKNPRFFRFLHEFTTQWLALEKFEIVEPDRQRFPQLTRHTRAQLRREPEQFLHYLILNNLSVSQLVESDFILANEVVASYYDLPEKPDSGFEFMAIPHRRDELGGLLTQPAILAGLSDGREPNAVKRGAWLARKIISEPPDDPPPNVPALSEDTQHLSLRERLERHRSQPGCIQCHLKIDPWGIPFEEFDASGRFTMPTTDAHAILPDNTSVDGVQNLRRYLVQHRIDQLAFSLLRHLTVYAVGRDLSWQETQYLKESAMRLKPDGYLLQDLIRFVVHSPMFLEK